MKKRTPVQFRRQLLEVDHLRSICQTHGICVDCGQMFSHWLDEPMASCGCKQSEWGSARMTPFMLLEVKVVELTAQLELLQAAINKNCVSPDGEFVPDWVAELDLSKTNALRVIEGKSVLAAIKYCNQHLAFLGGSNNSVAQPVVTVSELTNYAEILKGGL